MMKIRVDEVTEGQTVKGNLIGGTHVVAEIKTRTNILRNTSTEYSFYNDKGQEFFVGRMSAKATVA